MRLLSFSAVCLGLSNSAFAADGGKPVLDVSPSMAMSGFADICLKNFGNVGGLKKNASDAPWLMKDTKNAVIGGLVKGAEIWAGPGSGLFFSFAGTTKFCNMTFKVSSQLSSGMQSAVSEAFGRSSPDEVMPNGEKKWAKTGPSMDLDTTLQVKSKDGNYEQVVLTASSSLLPAN